MSYILDALKKAEQEHDIGAVPDLATPHETQPSQRRSNWWIWIFAALVTVNVVLAVTLLKDRAADGPAVTAKEPVAIQATPEPQFTQAAGEPVQAVQPANEAPVVAAPTLTKKRPPTKSPARSAGEVIVLPEPASLPAPRASRPEEEAAGIHTEVTTTAGNASNLPSWHALPQAFRNQLDLPRVDVHVYSDEPQKRFILVNLVKYREGDTLESGLVLEEVLPDGMVMSYQGERFSVPK